MPMTDEELSLSDDHLRALGRVTANFETQSMLVRFLIFAGLEIYDLSSGQTKLAIPVGNG
jgi:hypothetical protein